MKLPKIIPRKIRTFIYENILNYFYPYYISIVGEMILNPKFWEQVEDPNWRAGRVEVYKDGPYAEFEIRFCTNKKEWFDFEYKKDFSSYSKKGIEKLEKWIKENFDHAPSNRFKFNDGAGALVCNKCNRIIEEPISEDEAEEKVFKLCPNCNKI